MALAPVPGSSPACAEIPCTTSSNSPQPLRLPLSAPPGRGGWPPAHGSRGQDRDGNTRLHVEDARPVQPPVPFDQRHALDLADRPDGVVMPEHENLRGPAWKHGAHVIAAFHLGHTLAPP